MANGRIITDFTPVQEEPEILTDFQPVGEAMDDFVPVTEFKHGATRSWGEEPPEASWGEIEKTVAKNLPVNLAAGATGAIALGMDTFGEDKGVQTLLPAVRLLNLLKEPVNYAAKYWSNKASQNTEKLNLKPGSAKFYASMIQDSTAQQLPLYVGGLATGVTNFILPAMATLAAGQKKAQFLAEDIEGGNVNAVVQGGIEYYTEKLGLDKWVKPGLSFMKRLLSATAMEIPGEQIASVTQGALDKVALNPEMSWGEYMETLPGTVKDTLVVTIGQSLLMGGPIHAAQSYAERKAQKQQAVNQLKNQFQVPEDEAEKAVDIAEQNIEDQQAEPIRPDEIFDNPEEDIKRIRNAAILSQELGIDHDTALEFQDDIIQELENKIATESPVIVGEPQENVSQGIPKEQQSEVDVNKKDSQGPGSIPMELKGQTKISTSLKGFNPETDTLSTWVQKKGGINYQREFLKGELDRLKEQAQGKRMIINKKGNGKTLDDLTQQAIAEGFLEEGAGPREFLDLLEKDLNAKAGTGSPVFSRAKQEYMSEDEYVEGMKQFYKEQNLDKDEFELAQTHEVSALQALQDKLEKKYDRIITQVGRNWFFQMLKEEREKNSLLAKSMTLYSRRKQIKNIQDYFKIPENIIKKITKNRDIGLMSDAVFKKFKDDIHVKAVELEENQHAKAVLADLILRKRLQKVDNYRKAVLNLPPVTEMTTEQLKQYAEALEPFSDGDVFLTERELEVVDRTDLKGIKTWREAKEKLAQEAGTTVDKLAALKVSELDEYRYDTALAERDPFYKILVTETTRKLLEGNAGYFEVEQKAHELAKKSNASRSLGVMGRLIPQDKLIRAFLEAKPEDKPKILAEMTPEQIDYAHFIQDYFGKCREYLIKKQAISKGRENYFTHMRRTFLEEVKENGLKSAFKDIFKHYQQDEMVVNILDEDTGNILPLEKFFQFSLHRYGSMQPSENVTRVFLAYAKMFEKMVALDELIPKMDIYAQSLTPKQLTPRGLEVDRTIKTFVNKYINNKKGRKIRWIAKQDGPVDMAIRGVKTFTTLIDLGLNIPIQIASSIGEQVTTLEGLGAKQYALGIKRLATKEGRRIAKKYQNFTGKTAWDTLTEPDKQITERLSDGLFALFRESTARANQQFLLGSMTDEEFKNGEISSKRLAELSLEMGRWRQVEGSASIVGSTTAGGAAMQYKKWAVPIMRTTMKDISTFASDLKKRGLSEALRTREAQELKRLIYISSTAAIIGGMIAGDNDDDSFTGKIKAKAYREMMTLIQGVGIKLWLSVPRTLTFLAQLGNNLQQIITLEEYKTKEGYKGVEGLKKQLTPVAVKQLEEDQD